MMTTADKLKWLADAERRAQQHDVDIKRLWRQHPAIGNYVGLPILSAPVQRDVTRCTQCAGTFYEWRVSPIGTGALAGSVSLFYQFNSLNLCHWGGPAVSLLYVAPDWILTFLTPLPIGSWNTVYRRAGADWNCLSTNTMDIDWSSTTHPDPVGSGYPETVNLSGSTIFSP